MKCIGDLYAQSQKSLSHLPDRALDVSLIFMKVLGLTRAQLITGAHLHVPEEQQNKIEAMIRRRALYEPIAYIIGSKYFMGLEFYVDQGVLIPRGDTEILCEKTLEHLKRQSAERNEVEPNCQSLKGLEIGVGSGAISVSLLAYEKRLTMDAVDLSSQALRMTEKNADLHRVRDRLYLMEADALKTEFYESLKGNRYDVIISNPPYIREADKETLMADVVQYEPHMALFAKENGLAFYKAILLHADKILKKDGFLAFEIGYDQANAVTKIAQEQGFQRIMVIKDYEGHDRVVLAQR